MVVKCEIEIEGSGTVGRSNLKKLIVKLLAEVGGRIVLPSTQHFLFAPLLVRDGQLIHQYCRRQSLEICSKLSPQCSVRSRIHPNILAPFIQKENQKKKKGGKALAPFSYNY